MILFIATSMSKVAALYILGLSPKRTIARHLELIARVHRAPHIWGYLKKQKRLKAARHNSSVYTLPLMFRVECQLCFDAETSLFP
jgi:hypothetical protein